MNELTSKQPYTPPILEVHYYSLIVGATVSFNTLGLEPISDFMDFTEEQP